MVTNLPSEICLFLLLLFLPSAFRTVILSFVFPCCCVLLILFNPKHHAFVQATMGDHVICLLVVYPCHSNPCQPSFQISAVIAKFPCFLSLLGCVSNFFSHRALSLWLSGRCRILMVLCHYFIPLFQSFKELCLVHLKHSILDILV